MWSSLIQQTRIVNNGAHFFMLAEDGTVQDTVKAMKAGASDVFCKPIDEENLVLSVLNTLRQNVRFGPKRSGARSIEIMGFPSLTHREREVLELIANSKSNKEVGKFLGISPRTVEVHRARVMQKLCATNTADLMRIVLLS